MCDPEATLGTRLSLKERESGTQGIQKLGLVPYIQRNQGHRDSMMLEFSSRGNKVNNAITKVRIIGDRLPIQQSQSVADQNEL